MVFKADLLQRKFQNKYFYCEQIPRKKKQMEMNTSRKFFYLNEICSIVESFSTHASNFVSQPTVTSRILLELLRNKAAYV